MAGKCIKLERTQAQTQRSFYFTHLDSALETDLCFNYNRQRNFFLVVMIWADVLKALLY